MCFHFAVFFWHEKNNRWHYHWALSSAVSWISFFIVEGRESPCICDQRKTLSTFSLICSCVRLTVYMFVHLLGHLSVRPLVSFSIGLVAFYYAYRRPISLHVYSSICVRVSPPVSFSLNSLSFCFCYSYGYRRSKVGGYNCKSIYKMSAVPTLQYTHSG